jgi:hypothetical protein
VSPRVREDSVRPRLQSGACVQPPNSSVRRLSGYALTLGRLTVGALALVLYVCSLAARAIQWRTGEAWRGLALLESAPFALIFALPTGGAWLANVGFLLACVLFFRLQYKAAFWTATASVLLGFSLTQIGKHFPIPWDEAGLTKQYIDMTLMGFWLWLSAPALIAVSSALLYKAAPAGSPAPNNRWRGP